MNWRPLRLAASVKIICLLGLSCAAPQARVQAPPPVKSTSTTNQATSRITTTESTVAPSQSAYQPSAATAPSRPPPDPSPGSLAYLDFKNGFRDLKFGDAPMADMILKEESGDTKFYERSSDDLTLGGAQLRRIVYGFYKNRLYWVLLETNGLVNSRAMLDVVRQAYGSGYQGNRFLQQFAWFGSRVSGLYDENSVTSDARMSLQSKSISAEKETDQKAKARKGVGSM